MTGLHNPPALYAAGEMTEGQYLVACQFLRLVRVMQDRLSAGVAALHRCGLMVDEKPFDRAFWDLETLKDPINAFMVAHLDAQIDAHRATLDKLGRQQ